MSVVVPQSTSAAVGVASFAIVVSLLESLVTKGLLDKSDVAQLLQNAADASQVKVAKVGFLIDLVAQQIEGLKP